jgi:hypothetical protein
MGLQLSRPAGRQQLQGLGLYCCTCVARAQALQAVQQSCVTALLVVMDMFPGTLMTRALLSPAAAGWQDSGSMASMAPGAEQETEDQATGTAW